MGRMSTNERLASAWKECGRVRLTLQAPGMAQGDKRFVMSNHFVKGFAVGFGLGVILMVVAVVSYFS